MSNSVVDLEILLTLDVLVRSQMLVAHGEVQLVLVVVVVGDVDLGSMRVENQIESLFGLGTEQDGHDRGLPELHVGGKSMDPEFADGRLGDHSGDINNAHGIIKWHHEDSIVDPSHVRSDLEFISRQRKNWI